MSHAPAKLEVLLTHDAFVRALAKTLVFDENDAEDAAQDAWLSTLQNRPEDRGLLKSWFSTLVYNFTFRSRRASARRHAREYRSARREAVPSPDIILERERVRRAVVEAVLALDPIYRDIVILRFFEGRTVRETARNLSVPLETVRTRQKRAILQLRNALDRGLGGRESWCVALAPLALATMTTKTKGAAFAAVALILLSTAVWFTFEITKNRELNTNDRSGAEAPARMVASQGPAPEGQAGSSSREAAAGDITNSAAPANAATDTILRIHAFWEEDKTPAAGVILILGDLLEHPDPVLRAHLYTTDVDGKVEIRGVRGDNITIAADRGGSRKVSIPSGKTTDVDFYIPAGITVDGRVVDAAGAAVENAQIWLADAFTYESGNIITTSGRDGRFLLRAIRNDAQIAAFASGHGPSNLYRIRGKAGAKRSLQLVLRGAGGDVFGRVVDERGDPVRNALVRAGEDHSKIISFDEQEPRAPSARTDENGKFTIIGAPEGMCEVTARAARKAPKTVNIEITAGARRELDIMLESGCVVEGKIVTETGEPAVKIMIQAGGVDLLKRTRALTAADGTYQLVGVPAGETAIRATAFEFGKARAILQIAPGAPTVWNAKLTTDPKIAGVVISESGEPQAGWEVTADCGYYDNLEPFSSVVTTGAAGEFQFINCYDKEFTVSARPSGSSLAPAASVQRVNAGNIALRIVVPNTTKSAGRVVGTLVDAAGAPVEDATISVWQLGYGGPSPVVPNPQGRFRAGPLTPGTYRLEIRPRGYPTIRLPEKVLAKDETWDLGTIRLESPGSVRAEFSMEGGGAISKLQMYVDGDGRALRSGPGGGEAVTQEGNVAFVSSLAPGKYVWIVAGPSVVYNETPFEVRPGAQTRLSLNLQSARERIFQFKIGESEGDPRFLNITVDGAALARPIYFCSFRGEQEKLYELRAGLKEGNYRISAVSPSGTKVERSIEIKDSPEGGPVVIPFP